MRQRLIVLLGLGAMFLMLAAAPALAVLMNGTSGADNMTGFDGADTMYGKAGDDIMSGLGGGDRLYGQTGNDTLNGDDHTDQLYGQDGNDVLYGGGGDDRLAGHDGDDTLVGGGGWSDEFYGGPGTDTCVLSGPEHAKGHQQASCEIIVREATR